MFPIPYLTMAKYLAIAAFLTSLFVWGHHRGYASCEAKWNAEKIAQQNAVIAAQQAAQAKADSLTASLQADHRKIIQLTKEKNDALLRLTDNRPCLYPDAISLLNSAGSASSLPEAPAKPVGKATAGFAASDRDIARYLTDARSQYHDCASRLNALIEFNAAR